MNSTQSSISCANTQRNKQTPTDWTKPWYSNNCDGHKSANGNCADHSSANIAGVNTEPTTRASAYSAPAKASEHPKGKPEHYSYRYSP